VLIRLHVRQMDFARFKVRKDRVGCSGQRTYEAESVLREGGDTML